MPAIPSHADLTALMSTAQRIVVDASQILLQAFGTVSASRKADGTLVTQADHAVDDFLTRQIKDAFPDHAVLSEERNTIYEPEYDFTWVIDPLDGTTNFARGLSIWGISVALFYLGSPVLGLLSFPSLHENYTATINQGAYLNDRSLTTATDETIDDQHFLMMCTRAPRRYRIDTPLKPRMLGSATYHLVSVANGSAVAAIEATPKLWDIAAVLLILTEAGGCYHSLDKQTSIFPLDPMVADYERISYPLLAAANQTILEDLLPHIERKP